MHHTILAEDLMKIISNMRYGMFRSQAVYPASWIKQLIVLLDSHPMSVFISSFAAMGAFAPEANPSLQGRNLYLDDKATMNKNIIRIIGKAATVAAASMRVRMNRPFIAPRDDMTYTENMLYMMDALSEAEGYRPDKRLAIYYLSCMQTMR